jgi:biopolymer transport protein ExbD
MRVPTRGRGWGFRFNVTPLIDVVFNLIIFFLVASHFVRYELHQEVDLPSASQGERSEPETTNRLIVTVTPDERLHIGGRDADLGHIEQLIQAGHRDAGAKFAVRIRSDRGVPYRAIEPIILACARAGATNLQFAVIDE